MILYSFGSSSYWETWRNAEPDNLRAQLDSIHSELESVLTVVRFGWNEKWIYNSKSELRRLLLVEFRNLHTAMMEHAKMLPCIRTDAIRHAR